MCRIGAGGGRVRVGGTVSITLKAGGIEKRRGERKILKLGRGRKAGLSGGWTETGVGILSTNYATPPRPKCLQ